MDSEHLRERLIEAQDIFSEEISCEIHELEWVFVTDPYRWEELGSEDAAQVEAQTLDLCVECLRSAAKIRRKIAQFWELWAKGLERRAKYALVLENEKRKIEHQRNEALQALQKERMKTNERETASEQDN